MHLPLLDPHPAELGDVDGEEVELALRPPADGGLERDAVALARIGSRARP